MPSLNTGNAILSNAIAVNSSYNVGIGGAASGSYKLQVTGSDILVNGLTIGEGAGSIGSNTVVGASALPVNTTGTFNTAIGNSALLTNTTGYGNTSVGYSAIGYNTTGFFNGAVGVNALLSNTTGTYNNALGTAALYANTTGSYNTAVGQQAGTANTTGSNNTYIGYSSGLNITTGSNNTIIGNFAGTSALANNIVLADGAGNVRYQWDGTNNVFGNPLSGTSATFSSNVGLGVTPSNSTDPALQSRYGIFIGNDESNIINNGFFNSGFKYVQSSFFANRYYQDGYNGGHIWYTAPSGTAGAALTWNERMRITSGGNVGVDNTSPNGKFEIGSAGYANASVYGGHLFNEIRIPQATWTTFANVTDNTWNGITELTWTSLADYNRSGAAYMRWAYEAGAAALGVVYTLFNNSQNATATFRNSGGALQIFISGGAADYYVQVRVQGSRAA